ncbi:MAG TPA: class I SAM-dependent methyltransferase [Opitutaceae bacterium]|nr:class I SAM-dependent methyltransferase [Opitutaceae bacterium]
MQQTLDLFAGEWVSAMPAQQGGGQAGQMPLFDDPRIPWARQNLKHLGVDLAGASVLELGPLEGGHTYMLSRLGARSVTAIEANREAYLRCLVAKELLGVERVNFLYGDAIDFLRSENVHYDVSLACGFLYHMRHPVELIELLAKRSSAVYLWTVYWDPAFNAKNSDRAAAIGPAVKAEHGGFPHTLHRHDYGQVEDFAKFYGGPAAHANWMERDDILGAFAHFGFSKVFHELLENPLGSALHLVAVK